MKYTRQNASVKMGSPVERTVPIMALEIQRFARPYILNQIAGIVDTSAYL